MGYRSIIEKNDTKNLLNSPYINWDKFRNSTILVTGATGLIGTQIIDVLQLANKNLQTNIKILALVRNKEKAYNKFTKKSSKFLKYIVQDIQKEIKYQGKVDYIIHTANTTSSKAFVEEPVETINSIVNGTKNILEFAKKKNVTSAVYLSSMEVYGNIPLSRIEPLNEDDYGYLDILNPRSSYPEGKKIAESLCLAYFREYNVPVKIARLSQTIGAGVDYNDGRVFAQFARNIVEKQDIILKTKGETIRSYCYVTDAVSAIFSMLEKGKNGESYNIANPNTTCSIKEMAQMLCDKYPSSKLVIQIGENYYPNTTKYYLNTSKFYAVSGWQPKVDLLESFAKLISSFMYQKNHFAQAKLITSSNSLLEKIFSIQNVNTCKVITILGYEIKINRAFLNHLLYYWKPIKQNRIIINNFGGRGYGCNLKYIAQEILKRKLPYEILWMCRDEKTIREDGLPKEIKTTGYRNSKCIRDLYSAKLIISNVHCMPLIRKGWIKTDKQKYLQVWHGSLGIKKIDLSVKNDNSAFFTDSWHNLVHVDIDSTDYLISNSKFENDVYKEGFCWNKDIYQLGHPRNDVFFYSKEKQQKIKEKVFAKYNIDANKKILLYAPSFRDDKKINVYNLDFKTVVDSLKSKFGGDWVVMVRLHANLLGLHSQPEIFNYSEGVIDASFYPDMQELLVTADVGITDFSSWIFDFMLSRKPAFIYAEDIDEYNTERGFYYPLDSTPFPVAKSNEKIAQNIIDFNYDRYKNEIEAFLKEKGCIEDGHASERVVDLIEKIIAQGYDNKDE